MMQEPKYSSTSEITQASNSGLYATRNTMPLVARILLSGLFLHAGGIKILEPAKTQAYMAAHGMPLTGFFMIAAIVLELGAGLSLLLGFYARLAAAALAVFTFVTALLFHAQFADQAERIEFLKNLSVIGGLLMVVQYGAGNIAVRFRQRH